MTEESLGPTNDIDPNAENRHDQIVNVLRRLDSEVPLEKKPSVNDLKNAVGYQVTAAERDEAWDEFRPPEEPKPTPVIGADWPQIRNKGKSPIRIGSSKVILPGSTAGVMEWKELVQDSYAVKKMLEMGLIEEV